jgi:hypothetical protein
MARAFGSHLRVRHVAGLLVVAALAKALLAWSGPPPVSPVTFSGPRTCNPVQGTFTNVFLSGPVVCPLSPIALCTQGQLSGDLVGTYSFTFLTQTQVGNGNAPVERFTGMSMVTTADGTVSGGDFGMLRTTHFPLADFTTHLRFQTGTGAFEGLRGHLTIQGGASFATGLGSGTYNGVICTPDADDPEDPAAGP